MHTHTKSKLDGAVVLSRDEAERLARSGIICASLGDGRYAMPIMAGGDGNSPVAYPLGPPSVAGNLITVDEALNNPTRITRDVAQLAQLKFFADRIFTAGGGIEGGAVLFERPNSLATDLYATRDVKEVAPGEEFPLLTFARGVPMVARPRKIGGKWFVTKEARKRNDTALLARYMRQTANTITRRTELMAMAELSAVITAESRYMTGTSWSAYAGTALNTRVGTEGPIADLMAAQLHVDLEERGVVLNGIVFHPNEAVSIRQAYPNQSIGTLLKDVGIDEYAISPRQTAGRATLYAKGQVGEWRNEFPLEEEVEKEGVAAGGRQRTWYQWSISPSMVVTDQFALLELRGIA